MVDSKKNQNARPAAPPRAAGAPRGSRRVRSAELLDGDDQLIIEHEGREYRLRLTQNGKLILTA